MSEVSVRLNGTPVGVLSQDDLGEMRLTYLPEWLETPNAKPLSLSLPLREAPFNMTECFPFFSGLLPDSALIRKELGRVLQMSSEDDFGLLSAIGRDCAGAVSIVPTDTPVIRDTDHPEKWVRKTEAELADLLAALPNRPLYYDEDDGFFFSLAGVHDKIAVLVKNGEVVLPVNQTPSSHILKIDIDGLPDSIRTENFCLALARAVGIEAPNSEIRKAQEKPYMLIERYDRKIFRAADGTERLKRVHQEDFCQALGLPPKNKYQLRGGPGFKDLIGTINKASALPAKDVIKLLEYAAFNFVIGNPDAHGKNFSLVYRSTRPVLAPIYDLNSAYPFRSHYKKQIPRLAMYIGSATTMPEVSTRSLREMAEECDLRPKLVVDKFAEIAKKARDLAPTLREEFRDTVADSELLDDVVAYITKQARVLD